MVLVGIDNSVNSPGVVWFVLDENLKIERKNFLGFIKQPLINFRGLES